jgi:hypothetical protein
VGFGGTTVWRSPLVLRVPGLNPSLCIVHIKDYFSLNIE